MPEARMPETADLWQLTMEHSPVGMAILSPDGHFVTANIALCDMLGLDPEVLRTLSSRDVTHPDDIAAEMRLVGRALSGEITSYRISKRFICADGAVVLGDVSVALLRDAQGMPIHFVSQVVDLTERQAFVDRLDAAEAAADAERGRAHAVFDGVSVGILQIDAAGAYLTHNDRQSDILALAFPDGELGVAGQAGFVYDVDQRLLSHDEMPSVRAAGGEEFDDVRIWVGEDPTTRRALAVSARSVFDRAGVRSGAVLVYHDVTDMVRAMHVKDDFVSAVSHELRTPLTSALAYLELLDDSSDVSAEGHQQVSAARRNMLRLSRLVADLLLATRASAGSALVDRYEVDLVTVVGEAVDAATVHAEGAGVRLTYHRPETLRVVADGLRMRHVVDNLLANAVAFSPRGAVVTVSLATEGAQVVLTVTDEGCGIDPAEADEVFERFFRGSNARRLHVPGTGLGLHVVRTIIEAHGGTVRLDSAETTGTCVSVALPL